MLIKKIGCFMVKKDFMGPNKDPYYFAIKTTTLMKGVIEMRDVYKYIMKQEKRDKARQKALKDPEYQEIQKQIDELTKKKYKLLETLTDKYYKESEES